MAEAQKICPSCGTRYSTGVLFCPQDGSPLSARKTDVTEDPYTGLVIADTFELEQLVGLGSMGRVYRARQRGLDRDVAVKILHRDLLHNPTLVSRFRREAQVAASLPHPNIVHVFAVGELPRGEPRTDGETFMVLEYLDGISLRSALGACGGAMPLPRALHIMLQVCDAAGEAHAHGVVHRDLKPENVMLVRRGDDPDSVKVVDFGVARADGLGSSLSTQAGAIFGTASYISPEGAQGEPVDAPGDVYSIAAMLFHCLAGRPPFEGENSVSVLVKHTAEVAPDVRSIPRSSYVPEPIARVLASNLAKAPFERCRDARELGRALVQAATDSGLSADDLVLRATLLGGAGRPLQLASIQATKTLDLTPELSARMAGNTSLPGGPGHTQIDDRVQPSPPGEPSSPGDFRPSHMERPALPPARRRSRLIGALAIAGLVLGLALTVLMLRQTHIAREEPPSARVFVERAREALADERWDTPPGDNVLHLTRSALRKWPGHPELVAVRKRAARQLARRAMELAPRDRDAAIEKAQLAVELDPENERARQLLEGPPIGFEGSSASAADASPTEASDDDEKEVTSPVRKTRTPADPKPRQPATASPQPTHPDARAPSRKTAKGEGRWL